MNLMHYMPKPTSSNVVDITSIPIPELEARHQGRDEGVPGCDPEHGDYSATRPEGLLVNTPHHQPVILQVRLFQGSLLSDLWSLVRW